MEYNTQSRFVCGTWKNMIYCITSRNIWRCSCYLVISMKFKIQFFKNRWHISRSNVIAETNEHNKKRRIIPTYTHTHTIQISCVDTFEFRSLFHAKPDWIKFHLNFHRVAVSCDITHLICPQFGSLALPLLLLLIHLPFLWHCEPLNTKRFFNDVNPIK